MGSGQDGCPHPDTCCPVFVTARLTWTQSCDCILLATQEVCRISSAEFLVTQEQCAEFLVTQEQCAVFLVTQEQCAEFLVTQEQCAQFLVTQEQCAQFLVTQEQCAQFLVTQEQCAQFLVTQEQCAEFLVLLVRPRSKNMCDCTSTSERMPRQMEIEVMYELVSLATLAKSINNPHCIATGNR